MPDITLTIDGIEVTVPQGTVVVEAAKQVGINIPVFCHHPKLTPVGMCRMCLVEVGTPKMDPATKQPVLDADGKPEIMMMRGLQTACTNPVSQGMVVKTTTDAVTFARKGVLEMLLSSHPLDCPVCIKGGECPLQNLTMAHGPGKSRFDYEDKVHFQKPIPLSPMIDLDRERCILCARCVRFEDEIAGDPVLGFANRGRNWQIISKSDPPFNSKFSGNTVDICPVGALMNHEYRIAPRVWEVKPVPSICPHCPAGCNLTLDMRYREIKRVQPRENENVNEIWLCDRGRWGYHFVESDKRIEKPLVRRNGQLVESTWAEAIEIISNKFASVLQTHSGNAIAGLASGRLANEDLYLFQKLIRETLQSPNIDSRSGSADEGEHDDLGYAYGLATGTNLGDLGKGTAVLVIGADPEEEAPMYLLRLRGIMRRGGDIIVANGRPTKLGASATRDVRYQYGDEELFMMGVLRAILDAGEQNAAWVGENTRGLEKLRASLQPYALGEVAQRTGIAEDVIKSVATTLAKAENLVVVYGREALTLGKGMPQALGNLLLLTGKVGKKGSGALPILRYNNTRGALDMGIRPDRGPGYTNVPQRGMGIREIIDAATNGRIRALYVAGSDPAAVSPAAAAALERVDFVVVQELFLTPTAQLADVVLPAAAYAERDGTFTNGERRVQRFRQARQSPGEARPDWQIFATLGRAITALIPEPVATVAGGKGKNRGATAVAEAPAARPWMYRSTDDVNAEIVKTVGIYSGASYDKLRSTGGVWGRQALNENVYYDGTSYHNTEGLGIQWPTLAEQRKSSFDFIFAKPTDRPTLNGQLMMVSVPRTFNGGTLMENADALSFWVSDPYVGLSKDDAARLGIASGDRVRMTSSIGTIELWSRVVKDAVDGTALVPDLATIPLGAVQTGVMTPVRIEKIEG